MKYSKELNGLLLNYAQNKSNYMCVNVNNYSWTKAEINDFLSNIVYHTKKLIGGFDLVDDCFIGTIAIYEKENDSLHYIVDGTNRITTFALILLAIRDYIINNNLSEDYPMIINRIQEMLYNRDNDFILKSDENSKIEQAYKTISNYISYHFNNNMGIEEFFYNGICKVSTIDLRPENDEEVKILLKGKYFFI